MKNSPRDLILDQKEEGVKLNEHAIVKGKPMDRQKIFRCMWNM
jgi:hypothetical protein